MSATPKELAGAIDLAKRSALETMVAAPRAIARVDEVMQGKFSYKMLSDLTDEIATFGMPLPSTVVKALAVVEQATQAGELVRTLETDPEQVAVMAKDTLISFLPQDGWATQTFVRATETMFKYARSSAGGESVDALIRQGWGMLGAQVDSLLERTPAGRFLGGAFHMIEQLTGVHIEDKILQLLNEVTAKISAGAAAAIGNAVPVIGYIIQLITLFTSIADSISEAGDAACLTAAKGLAQTELNLYQFCIGQLVTAVQPGSTKAAATLGQPTSLRLEGHLFRTSITGRVISLAAARYLQARWARGDSIAASDLASDGGDAGAPHIQALAMTLNDPKSDIAAHVARADDPRAVPVTNPIWLPATVRLIEKHATGMDLALVDGDRTWSMWAIARLKELKQQQLLTPRELLVYTAHVTRDSKQLRWDGLPPDNTANELIPSFAISTTCDASKPKNSLLRALLIANQIWFNL